MTSEQFWCLSKSLPISKNYLVLQPTWGILSGWKHSMDHRIQANETRLVVWCSLRSFALTLPVPVYLMESAHGKLITKYLSTSWLVGVQVLKPWLLWKRWPGSCGGSSSRIQLCHMHWLRAQEVTETDRVLKPIFGFPKPEVCGVAPWVLQLPYCMQTVLLANVCKISTQMSWYDVPRMTGDPSIAGLVLDSPFSDLKAGSSGGRIHLCRTRRYLPRKIGSVSEEFQCEVIDWDKQFLCAENNCERREAVLAVSASSRYWNDSIGSGAWHRGVLPALICSSWAGTRGSNSDDISRVIRIGASRPSSKLVEACGSL